MIDAVPSREGRQFIIGGNRDNNGALSHIYDISSAKWFSTPDLPGLENNMVDYKRGNVGMTMDTSTGFVYIYGGFGYRAFSKELDILDTSSSDPLKMTWSLAQNQTTIPTLYQPFVHYLPSIKKVIVMGGCPYFDPGTGLVGLCAPLSIGYLISGGPSAESLSIETRPFSIGPLSRYQSCRVVLGDGNLFIQGGRDPNQFFKDAWILDVVTWTWRSIDISGSSQTLTRAGHSCQLGPNGQIIVVGGFSNVGNVSQYVQPYMVVVDSNTWTVTTGYKGAPLSSIWTTVPLENGPGVPSGSGLSTGAKAGIGAGIAVALIALILGFLSWRRKKNNQQNTTLRADTNQSSPGAEKADSANQLTSYSHSDVNHLMAISASPSPILPGSGISPSIPPSQIEYIQDGRQYVTQYSGGTGPLLQSEPSISSLPLYSENVARTFPINDKEKSNLSGSHNYSDIPRPGLGATDDAALAAALLRSEDLASSAPLSMKHFLPSKFNENHHIPLQSPVVVHTVRAPESHIPGANYMLVPLPQKSSPQALSNLSTEAPFTSSPRVPTLHTPVVNTTMYGGSAPRSNHGPQSVPENEAWIERSSPGVKTHVVSARDLNTDGHFAPLTPTRTHAPNSVLVGTPASNVTSTASSFSAATSSLRYPVGSDSSYFGPVLGGNSNSSSGQRLESIKSGSGTGSSTPYRDPQIMKDLDDITKLIESQTMAETKNPHTIVSSRPDTKTKPWRLQGN
ncbi:hypothetical protein BGZ76_000744 [Entomortierella beljakovae]|nr:hypothetical protein BGZ76_000744 [Entomortierella beljakovae]